jgi:uncharacterized protein (DUF58 family)
MLLTAINFSNSLIFLLTFFLASLAIISMLFTQKSLLGLTIETNIAKPAFCNQKISIPLLLSTDQIYLTNEQKNSLPSSIQITYHHFTQNIDILNNDKRLYLDIKTKNRGYIQLDPITISSTFPFGLFYAWSIVKLTNKSIVYPEIIKFKQAIQRDFMNAESGENEQSTGMEDFAGLDKYKAGQSLKKVHWKVYAKQQGMYIKNYTGGAISNKYWFSLELFDSHIDIEKRLSYLSYLIDDAEIKGHSYGLKMPQQIIAINSGSKHKNQCLKVLALY